VKAILGSQLRVKGDGHDPALARRHGMTVDFGQDLHTGTVLCDPRGADEHPAQRPSGQSFYGEIGLEGAQLAPEGVALGSYVHDREMLSVEHDQPRARAKDGHSGRVGGASPRRVNAREPAQRVGQSLTLDAQAHRGGLPAGDHQAVETVEVCQRAHLAHTRAQTLQDVAVRLEVALQGEHADRRRSSSRYLRAQLYQPL
jgi:hypothetical protein